MNTLAEVVRAINEVKGSHLGVKSIVLEDYVKTMHDNDTTKKPE